MPTTVLAILESRFPEARKTTLREMISDKRVWIGKAVAKSFNQPVQDGESLVVRDRPKKLSNHDALQRSFELIYEDEDLFVIDKPAGLITSSGQRDKRPTAIGILNRHFENYREIDVGLIHRLDKDASGLLVFSKHAEAFHDLKRQFADKSAGREYFAIVERAQPVKPATGRLESYLVELTDGRVVITTNKHKGDHAILDYECVEERGKFAQVKVRLFTGRKHQIRVQLSARGWPIMGDAMYHEMPTAAPRLLLHARRLELTHPATGKALVFESPIPKEVVAWWELQPRDVPKVKAPPRQQSRSIQPHPMQGKAPKPAPNAGSKPVAKPNPKPAAKPVVNPTAKPAK